MHVAELFLRLSQEERVMTSKRYEPAIRQEMILRAAIAVASRPGGWGKMTRAAIAEEADCSDGLVSRYLGDIPKIRRRVMKAAIKDGLTDVIVQSVVACDGFAPKSAKLTALLG
jgi:AcrR family transcriptional regulator